MEEEKAATDDKNCHTKSKSKYKFGEDMAILDYMIADSRFLKSSGIQVWKDAEKLQICPGRSYLSMKERFRKIIVKNLKEYKVDKDIAIQIIQFMRADQEGKAIIRLKQS